MLVFQNYFCICHRFQIVIKENKRLLQINSNYYKLTQGQDTEYKQKGVKPKADGILI